MIRALHTAFRCEVGLRGMALAALTGVLTALSFPTASLDLAVFVALVPLMISVRGRSPACGFVLGCLAGQIGIAMGFYWVFHAIRAFGGFSGPVAAVLFLLWMLPECVYWGIIGLTAVWAERGRGPFRGLFWVPLVVALEFFYPRLFPWHFGDPLVRRPALIQIADVAGIWGVSLLVVWVNFALGRLYLHLFCRERPFPWFAVVGAAVLVGSTLAYGPVRLEEIRERTGRAPVLKALLVQGNVDLRVKGENSDESFDRYARATVEALRESGPVDLVVWPESAFVDWFTTNEGGSFVGGPRIQGLRWLARRCGATIVAGVGTYRIQEDRVVDAYNTAVVTDGSRIQHYHKNRRLLFGEKFPFTDWFPVLKEWVGRTLAAGTERPIFKLGDVPFAVVICYEGTLSDYVRDFGRRGIAFLVNVTEDGWYGPTCEPYQHLDVVTPRAVELRVPILRVTNRGTTSVIAATGAQGEGTPLYRTATPCVTFRPLAETTPYERPAGWLLPWACIVLAGVLLAASIRRRMVWN